MANETRIVDEEKGDNDTGLSPPHSATSDEVDADVVDWDGPDDPENPLNWPKKKKWSMLGTLSVMTILIPLGSSMFAPGVPDIMADFNTNDENIATFVVSVYVLGFAFGPLIAAPLSETYGRAIVFNVGNVMFLLCTIGTALSVNMPMLIVFRFLMGVTGSPPITNGSGMISDMFPVQERGRAMAIWAMGPLLGPSIGPIAGGFVVESIGWRWVFWIIAIVAGVLTTLFYFIVVETSHITLLQRRVNALRASTSNPNLKSALSDGTASHRARFELAIVRPIKFLFTLPHFFLLSLYVAVEYGILYLMISTFTFVYAQQYGFSASIVGLAYIPTGVGMMLGAGTFGIWTDRLVKKKLASGQEPTPEDRLPLGLTITSGGTVAVGLFWYGWSAEANAHWIVPMLGVAVFCFGLMGVMTCVQMYLIDSYIRYAASVVAALTVLRSIIGAILPLSGLSLYNALGWGWGNSVLGFMSIALAPVPVLFYYYGPQARARFPANF